jgi:protein-disulfide isomerase
LTKKQTTESNPWMFFTLFLGALLVASLVVNGVLVSKVMNTVPGAAAPNPIAPAAPSAPQAPQMVQITNPAQAPVLGNADAPVTITEFSDFQCPFCKRFNDQTFGAIKTQYVETGQAKVVFRHLPLPFHPEAQPAAEASMCAHDQGEFWAFHDLIFANQATMSSASYTAWATQLGLDMGEFNDCVSSRKYQSYVEADYQAASAVGISGTPSFVVNDELVVGAQPTSVFQQVIESKLS